MKLFRPASPADAEARRERSRQLRDQINAAYANGPDPEEQAIVDAMWELQREVVLAYDDEDPALLGPENVG